MQINACKSTLADWHMLISVYSSIDKDQCMYVNSCITSYVDLYIFIHRSAYANQSIEINAYNIVYSRIYLSCCRSPQKIMCRLVCVDYQLQIRLCKAAPIDLHMQIDVCRLVQIQTGRDRASEPRRLLGSAMSIYHNSRATVIHWLRSEIHQRRT